MRILFCDLRDEAIEGLCDGNHKGKVCAIEQVTGQYSHHRPPLPSPFPPSPLLLAPNYST